MKPPRVSVLHGSTFVVSDTRGDVTAGSDDVLGLVFEDVRHLVRAELSIRLDADFADIVEVTSGSTARSSTRSPSTGRSTGSRLSPRTWATCCGLMRHGCREAGSHVAHAVLDAAESIDQRLPEVFAGFDRRATVLPVECATACSPQAWATGSALPLLRVLLGLEPDGDTLRTTPCVPDDLGAIRRSGIRGRWGTADASSDA